MAEILPGERQQADHDSFFRDDAAPSKAYRRVSDQAAQDLLGEILAVLGGVTGTTINEFDDVAAVATGVETVVVAYTVPVGQTLHLHIVEFTGSNIGLFNLYADGAQVAQRRTNFGSDLSGQFTFLPGLSFSAGQVLELRVINPRPSPGDFSGRIQGVYE